MPRRFLLLVVLALTGASPLVRSVDWPAYGNNLAGLKYSPLTDINRENVATLDTAFTWSANEQSIPAGPDQKPARPGQFQVTPLAIHDTLFFSTPFNRVIALDANTGREYWSYDPQPWKTYGQPSNGTGFVHRGVATWTNGRERRVFINSRWRLIALDAANGKPIASFGMHGEVDLTASLSRPVRKEHYTNTSPPVVWGNLVILGNGVGDRLVYRGDPPGDIQAFDVITGRRVWRFRTVPPPGEFGNNTWKDSSWAYEGHTNAWAPFTVDSARGLVYLPIGTPSNDWYGGERKGANLFAESILCLDARTGRRVWHYQITHHGLWDYDIPAPPNLVTITHDGRRVDAVAVPTKQGFLFVFDRVTGRPLWSIEERKVPASDVPGEEAWPTQPVPTKPAPYARQGFSTDDVIDFTPELKAAALAEIARYHGGPMYTPPSIEGTVALPGVIGGSGWGGASVDPETGWIYLKSTNEPALFTLQKRETPSDTVDAPYMVNLRASSIDVTLRDSAGRPLEGGPLPLLKPPYGALTAIDLNTGETKWSVPLGDSPEVRNHPALRGVALPAKLGVVGSPGSLVTKGGLVFTTGGGRVLYAIDSRTGATLWERDLGQVGYANPMTYRTRAGRQFVMIATGAGSNAKLVAFALPASAPAPRQPQRVIFDTDMGNDVDDAIALAALHALESRGESRLLAVTLTKDEPFAAAYVDLVNTFYGRPDIPIGVTRSGITPNADFEATVAQMRGVNGRPLYPHDLVDGRTAPEATALLRRVLAAQPDSSVVMVQTGFSTNLAALLDTPGDSDTPLDGRALVARKVRLLQVMAGRFNGTDDASRDFLEFNVKIDIPSARALFARWPTPIEVSGFEVGVAVVYPAESIERDFAYVAHHPIRDGYVNFRGARWPYDRPTWDVTSVLEAVRPDRAYFGHSIAGRVIVDERGRTSFRPEPGGPHRYLTVSAEQAVRARATMVQLASQPPRGHAR